MNPENTLARLARNTGPARMFVPVGIILIIFGFIMYNFRSDTMLETTGTITSVVDDTTEKNKPEYDISFTYAVNGKTYEGTFENLPGDYIVGNEIKVYYDTENPEKITNSKMSGAAALAVIGAGAASILLGILMSVKAFRKSKELDQAIPENRTSVDFDGYMYHTGVKEYYCRFDGNTLSPGYIIEDADRKILYEAKMVKNSLVGARIFEFTDHTTGRTAKHEVGHTVTQTYNNEFFSVSSWFKMDGQNIWDLIHDRGIRMNTDLTTKFPYVIYEVSRNGRAFARIESSSIHVHEEDEAQHKIVVPYGRYYYRIWTDSADLESVFLPVFALSETEQPVAE